MPWMPISASASFTSSSLNGLMMAMMSFIVGMGCRDGLLFDVAFLAVFHEVEALALGFGGRPQADHHLHDIRENERGRNGQEEREADGLELFVPQAAFGSRAWPARS